jgi:hypothetical protein
VAGVGLVCVRDVGAMGGGFDGSTYPPPLQYPAFGSFEQIGVGQCYIAVLVSPHS